MTKPVQQAERTRLEEITLAMIAERGLKLNLRKTRVKGTIRSLEALMVSWEAPANGTRHSQAEVMAATAEIGWVLDVITEASDALTIFSYQIMSSMRAILMWSWIHRNSEETPDPKRVVAALADLTKTFDARGARAFFAELLGRHQTPKSNMRHSDAIIQSAWKLIDAINSTRPKKSPVIKMSEELIAARARGDLAHSVAKEQAWDQTPPEALGWQNLHEQTQAVSRAAVSTTASNISGAGNSAPTVLATLRLIADQQQIIIEQNNRIEAALGL